MHRIKEIDSKIKRRSHDIAIEDTLSHSAMANATTDIFVFASTEGVTSKFAHTLFLIQTITGAPVGEEVVDQFLILILPSATKTVPPIRNSRKEDSGLEAFHLTGEHALVCLLVNMRTIFTTIPPAHKLQVDVGP